MRGGLRQLVQSLADHLARDARGPGYRGDATPPPRLALCSGQQSAGPLVQHRLQEPEAVADASRVIHPLQNSPKHSMVVMLFYNSAFSASSARSRTAMTLARADWGKARGNSYAILGTFTSAT